MACYVLSNKFTTNSAYIRVANGLPQAHVGNLHKQIIRNLHI